MSRESHTFAHPSSILDTPKRNLRWVMSNENGQGGTEDDL